MSEKGKQNLRKHKKNQICVMSWEELQQRLEQVTEHIYKNYWKNSKSDLIT